MSLDIPDETREQMLALAIIKRRGRESKDAYVLTTISEFFGLHPSNSSSGRRRHLPAEASRQAA